MPKSLAFAWTVTATLTIYIASASAQKAEKPAAAPAEKAAAAPAGGPPPGPPKPGPEVKAMMPVVTNYTWSDGKMAAGSMGPGSPELPTKGKQTCKWIMGGLFAMCDIEDTAGTGKTAMKWQGHLLMGWDVEMKAYRGAGVDNMGAVMVMAGKLDGTKFSWESVGEAMMMGQPMKMRITFDFSDAKAVKFTDERSIKGGPFTVAETATFKPAGK